MREAIITIVEPATDGEPSYTKVFRVEFEGEFTLDDGDQYMQAKFEKTVNSEQLIGHREAPGVTGR